MSTPRTPIDDDQTGTAIRWRAALAWIVAAAAAVAVASWAVAAATQQVSDPTAALLTHASPDDDPTVSDASSPVEEPSESPSPDDDPSESPSPDDSPSDEVSPADDPSPSESPDDDATPVSTAAETRTASSVGGSASFRFENGEVTLLWARPEPGFEVDIEREPGEVRARFRSGSHESRIKGDWEDGQPRIRVEERPEDDG